MGKYLRKAQRGYFMFKTFANLVRRGQFTELRHRTQQKVHGYGFWFRRFGTLRRRDRAAIRSRIQNLKHLPKFSIVMPTYNSPDTFLREAMDSVLAQLYPHWELCIADDASTLPSVRSTLEEYARRDARIRITYREKNGRIAVATNSALALATGDFIALLDHDDELTEHALYLFAEELQNHPEAQMLYSDQDRVDAWGKLTDPMFKPDWSPDLLRSMNYVNHLVAYRAERVRAIGGLRDGFDGSQDYDLLLRFTEKLPREAIRHIPFVLYHWRAIPGSIAFGSEEKSYAHDNARRALTEHLKRMDINAEVQRGRDQYHRVKYHLPSPPPLVSLIVGTRDRVGLMRGICGGILNKTDYHNFELIIVDNGSTDPETLDYLEELKRLDERVRVVRHDAPFNFSQIYNLGVSVSKGAVIGLINNDIEVIRGDWLEEMVSQALRPEVGAVGARLLYGEGTLQHGGVVTGIGLVAGHSHKHLDPNHIGHMARPYVINNYSAVTAACVFLRREIFDEVGGLDEKNLAIAFNDVDLCLKIREKGYWIVYTPHAELYHLESVSRGPDNTATTYPRFLREQDFMVKKWGHTLPYDPFYSPNLTNRSENFAFAYPPRVPRPWIPVTPETTETGTPS